MHELIKKIESAVLALDLAVDRVHVEANGLGQVPSLGRHIKNEKRMLAHVLDLLLRAKELTANAKSYIE